MESGETMAFVTVTSARSRIPDLARSAETTVLTHNGEPVAMLVPIREYRAIRALLKLAAHPELLQHVLSAHQKVQRGDLSEFSELK